MLRIPFRSDNVEERQIFFIDLINLQSPKIFWSQKKIEGASLLTIQKEIVCLSNSNDHILVGVCENSKFNACLSIVTHPIIERKISLLTNLRSTRSIYKPTFLSLESTLNSSKVLSVGMLTWPLLSWKLRGFETLFKCILHSKMMRAPALPALRS